MTRPFAAAAAISLALGATYQMAPPYDIGALGVASILLYRLVQSLDGPGAARVAVALLLASVAPTLSAPVPPQAVSLSALATLSLIWWVPLLIGTRAIARFDRTTVSTLGALAAWWAVAAAAALMAPAPWASMASRVETAAAAALAGMAVARLAHAAGATSRRSTLISVLTATCLWQAWLVVGTGRPARVLVPMLVAALMIAATDLLTDESYDERDGVGAAIVIAMLVLGLVPGAHTLVAQQQAVTPRPAPAAAIPGAETPSAIAAP